MEQIRRDSGILRLAQTHARRVAAVIAGCAIIGFFFGPICIRRVYRATAPSQSVDALRRAYHALDVAESDLTGIIRASSFERRRAIAAWLDMRDIAVDPGIRDEHIERAPIVRRSVMKSWWNWKDLVHYWTSDPHEKDVEFLLDISKMNLSGPRIPSARPAEQGASERAMAGM